jgi:hypothetical protein
MMSLVATQQRLFSRESEIEHLKLLIAKLRRMQFGRKSEKLERQIEQLELKLEELESAKASPPAESLSHFPVQARSLTATAKNVRWPLPEHLHREVKTYAPKEETCAECGGRLRRLGEDVSEVLEYVPAHFKVMLGIPVKVNADSGGKPNGVPVRANSRRSEATLAC